MISIGNYNPLSCDNYINAGNYFQKQFSNDSNLIIRTALVFAKIVGRGQDVLIHAGLGSIKLIASTTMAIYSIPAAAFGCIPTHHKAAKQASRHFALGIFYIADIFLSFTNIANKYPQHLIDKLQKYLAVENINEEIDVEFEQILQVGKEMSIRATSQKIQQLQEQLDRATDKIQQLEEENKALLNVCTLQEQLIQSINTQPIKAS